MDLATLWRTPITIKRVNSENTYYLYMQLKTDEFTTHKLMRMTPRFCNSVKHSRGLKASTKLSKIRMDIFKLFMCENAVEIVPVELEQETQAVNLCGEYEPCYTMYKYLLLLIQKFLTEVIDERKKLL